MGSKFRKMLVLALAFVFVSCESSEFVARSGGDCVVLRNKGGWTVRTEITGYCYNERRD